MLDIPPGDAEFVVTDEVTLPIDVELHAVYPHAHYLAKSMEGKATLPDGAERWLIRIDDWDFNWQDVYRVREPYVLPAGTTLSMRFTYDNSADNPRNPSDPPQHVRAGNQSSDEMAHLQLQVRPRRAADLVLLRESLYQHAIERNPANPWSYYELGNALLEQDRVDEAAQQYLAGLAADPTHVASRASLGAVRERQGRLEEAVGHLHETLALEPNHAAAHANLGHALRELGRLDEAVTHHREALRLRPGSAEAHNNLGSALAVSGLIDEAIEHFQSTLRLQPDHMEARQNLELAYEIAAELERAGLR